MQNELDNALYNIDNDPEKLSKFKRQNCSSTEFCPYEKCKFATNGTCTSYIFDKTEIELSAVEEVS